MRLVSVAAMVLLQAVTAGGLPSELNDTATCDGLGFTNLTIYQRRFYLTSPYGAIAKVPIFIPLYSSHALNSDAAPNDKVTTALIFIHGLSGAANTYFCTGAASAIGRDVIVIAPWFGDEQVNGTDWGTSAQDSSSSAYWSTSRWMYGGDTSPGGPLPARWTTSFDAMDAIIANISTLQLFPNLRQVTVVGFSAGSQYTLRYAFASPVGGASGAGSSNVHVRFIVSDPSSYLYLDASRPASECRPLLDDGMDAAPRCTNFTYPNITGEGNCSTYNNYKYGLSAMGYQNLYCAPFDTNATLLANAVARFGLKDVVYIMGAADTCNCNAQGYDNDAYCFHAGLACTPNAFGGAGCCDTYPDATTSNAVDTACAAMLQGSNRLQRGLLYMAHLRRVFPQATFTAATVAGMGHNNSALYASAPYTDAAYWTPPASTGDSAAPIAAAVGGCVAALVVFGGAALAIRRYLQRRRLAVLVEAEASPFLRQDNNHRPRLWFIRVSR